MRNSIRHLYDNESITFSQLLVKAHRNEEEETTSRVVSKNMIVQDDTTLEQRVDRLIAKSNSNPAPDPQPQVNRDNSRNYCRFQSNPQSKRDYRQSPGCPQFDIRQNLRGPEPSAAGPFGETDVSRPIQCFRCRGWGHPKRLCPSRLNYTQGGMVWHNPSPTMERRPEGSPPQNPSPQQ